MPPDHIAKYRVERLVGSGTFATVYLAYDPDLESYCAVKLLADNWSQDESARRWFLQEARVMFGIEHPRICRVFTSGTLDDGRPYFVMEYADRGNLAERMQQRRESGVGFTHAEALEISLSIAEGLQAAHSRGIAHRDLKPRNILIRSVSSPGQVDAPADVTASRDEEIKLADFGLARQLEMGTNSLAGAGSPLYMAPEQLRASGEDRPDPRSDIYAAAVVLYELLAGRVPFPYASLTDVVTAHLTEEPPPIQSLRQDIPDDIAALVHTGLAKESDQRIATAVMWADSLRSLLLQHRASDPLPSDHDGAPDEHPSGQLAGPADEASAAKTLPVTAVPPAWRRRREAARRLSTTLIGPTRARRPPPRPHPPEASEPVVRPGVMTYFGGLAAAAVLVGMVGLIILSLRPTASPSADLTPTPVETPEVAQGGLVTPTPTPIPTPTPTRETVAVVERPELTPTPTPTPEPTPAVDPETLQQIEASLADLPGAGSSVVVLPDGSVVERGADRQVPAASLIKLWIAAAAYDEAASGDLDLEIEHVIQSSEQAPGTGILNGPEFVGQRVSYEEMIQTMLLYSDNTAANIIVDRIGGLDRVNRYASEHGYEGTRMQRRLGQLDPSHENYTTALDSARFLSQLIEDEVVDPDASRAIREALLGRRSNDGSQLDFFGRELSPGVEYAHISGLLPAARSEAGYFLTPDGQPVIVIILLDTLPSVGAGESAIARTVGAIYDRTSQGWTTAGSVVR
jgi:serine/threonine protein kinase/beta-lactamase class A